MAIIKPWYQIKSSDRICPAIPGGDSPIYNFKELTSNGLQIAILHFFNGCLWSDLVGCPSGQSFLSLCQNNICPIFRKATSELFFDSIGGQPFFDATRFAIQYVSGLIESFNLCWTICSFYWTRYPNIIFSVFLADFSTDFYKFNFIPNIKNTSKSLSI